MLLFLLNQFVNIYKVHSKYYFMLFKEISELFEELEKTSKRLEKIMILRDFYFQFESNSKEIILLYDIISGNFQRKIDKKTLGISLKTVFNVIGEFSSKSQSLIEKEFNKIGDVGEVAQSNFNENNQQSLISQGKLTLSEIISTLEKISSISGKDSNKRKVELLTNLFFKSRSKLEVKFLARLLIDDLRVGTSIGTLRESLANIIFPKIIEIHKVCPDCNYINLNLDKCLKCSCNLKKVDFEEIYFKDYEIFEIKKEVSREIIEEVLLKFKDNKNLVIKAIDFREVYNYFLSLIENKYNLLNSFSIFFDEIENDILSIFENKIVLGVPIKSMLGVRANTVEQAFESTNRPCLADFKYDGLRAQIHNNKGEVRIFSRNLEEITKQFPEVVDFIKTNFSDLSFVVDSECVGFDFKSGKFLDFQVLSRRIMTKNVEEVSHINVCVKAFDILYLNDETLISKVYEERREILENIFLNRKLRQKIHFDEEDLKNL